MLVVTEQEISFGGEIMLRSEIGHLLRGIRRMATLTRLIRPTKALCHRPDKRSAIRQYRETQTL